MRAELPPDVSWRAQFPRRALSEESSSGEPEGKRGRALGPAEVDTARCRQSGGVEASGGCGGLLSHRLHSSRRY